MLSLSGHIRGQASPLIHCSGARTSQTLASWGEDRRAARSQSRAHSCIPAMHVLRGPLLLSAGRPPRCGDRIRRRCTRHAALLPCHPDATAACHRCADSIAVSMLPPPWPGSGAPLPHLLAQLGLHPGRRQNVSVTGGQQPEWPSLVLQRTATRHHAWEYIMPTTSPNRCENSWHAEWPS